MLRKMREMKLKAMETIKRHSIEILNVLLQNKLLTLKVKTMSYYISTKLESDTLMAIKILDFRRQKSVQDK